MPGRQSINHIFQKRHGTTQSFLILINRTFHTHQKDYFVTKSFCCLARHPSSTLKNLEVILFWFWSSNFWQVWACSVMNCIWTIECFYFCFPGYFKYNPWWIVFEIPLWKLFWKSNIQSKSISFFSLFSKIIQIHSDPGLQMDRFWNVFELQNHL